MRLDLMGWHQCGQDHPSFLVAIALTEELFDASEGVPDQFHTPSNLVVAHWPADVESNAPLDFLLRHAL